MLKYQRTAVVIRKFFSDTQPSFFLYKCSNLRDGTTCLLLQMFALCAAFWTNSAEIFNNCGFGIVSEPALWEGKLSGLCRRAWWRKTRSMHFLLQRSYAFHGVPQGADIWVSLSLFDNLNFLNVSAALVCPIHISCNAETLFGMLQLWPIPVSWG